MVVPIRAVGTGRDTDPVSRVSLVGDLGNQIEVSNSKKSSRYSSLPAALYSNAQPCLASGFLILFSSFLLRSGCSPSLPRIGQHPWSLSGLPRFQSKSTTGEVVR